MTNTSEQNPLSPDEATQEAQRLLRKTEAGRAMVDAIILGDINDALDTPDDSERNIHQTPTLEDYAAAYDTASDAMWAELDNTSSR